MSPRRRSRWLSTTILLTLIGTGIGLVLAQTVAPPEAPLQTKFGINSKETVLTTSEGLRYIVDPSLLVASGADKDGIPSIDMPSYVSVEEADQWISDNELVLVLSYKGVTRVYPLQILVWHEIVNDIVAGDPILITYCPLCGSGMAYDRRIAGAAVEFGTSGNLYNSNLVMYDRQTGTYWSQMEGIAIVGELSGQQLVPISLDTVVWRDWKTAHPDSEVLSQATGFNRDYGLDPYGGYYEDNHTWFPVQVRDDRIPQKTVILGIEINGAFVAYRELDVTTRGTIQDRVNGINIRITQDSSGEITVVNLSTQEVISKERSFWFAWYAFHPDTRLYLPSG